MKQIFVIFMLIFAFGSNDDTTEPSEDTIVGKWMKNINSEKDDDVDILVIEFTSNNEYIVTDGAQDIESDTLKSNYSYDNNIITMSDDGCKDEDGKYELKFRNNGVEFILIEDECDRSDYMTGFFNKYKATLYD